MLRPVIDTIAGWIAGRRARNDGYEELRDGDVRHHPGGHQSVPGPGPQPARRPQPSRSGATAPTSTPAQQFARPKVPTDTASTKVIVVVDLTVILIGICFFSLASAESGSSTAPTSGLQVTPHNGTIHLANIGHVIFSTKAATLHFSLNPFGLLVRVQDILEAFFNTSNLLHSKEPPQNPFLQEMLMIEIEDLGKTLTEFRTTLENLAGNAKRRETRFAEWLGLGLSIFNAGWSTYLSSQVFDLSQTSSHLKITVGQLQHTVKLQDRQIRTLAQSILEFQANVHELTETMAAVKIINDISRQIHDYIGELNSGIHSHRLPYTLFNPIELKDAWQNLTSELDRQNLSPIFSDRPSQLYELDADYFLINNTFHVFLNVPVKDKNQMAMSLHRTLPSLIFLRGSLFLYEDETYVATATGPSNNSVKTVVSKEEIRDCRSYGSLYCCPKRIYPINKKYCPDELAAQVNTPSSDCMGKFILIDPKGAYVTSKQQNVFDFYSPQPQVGILTCANSSPTQIPLQFLQEIQLPEGCTLMTSQYRIIATYHFQFNWEIKSDPHLIIPIADLLIRIPEIDSALQYLTDPLKQIFLAEPITMQDLLSENRNTPFIVYVSISLSLIIIIMITVVVCCCRNRFKTLRENRHQQEPFLPMRPYPMAQEARHIELSR